MFILYAFIKPSRYPRGLLIWNKRGRIQMDSSPSRRVSIKMVNVVKREKRILLALDSFIYTCAYLASRRYI